MAKRLDIYKCEVCGNIVEMNFIGGGTLTCCDQEMTFMEEKTADMATEKHVPVVEKVEGGYKVTVGSTLHPMTEEHYIQWIQLVAGDLVMTQFLKPGQEPVAFFKTDATDVYAREYCNLHGNWKS